METLAEDSVKEGQMTSNARYVEVVAFYQAVDQPNQRIETTSIFA